MITGRFRHWALVASLAIAGIATPGQAGTFEKDFYHAFGTAARAPKTFSQGYSSDLERQVAALASGDQGRIGVAAIDLSTGRSIGVLGNQRFPMASTSKIAVAATFLDGVERGRWSLDSKFPMLVPVSSQPFSTAVAPVRNGPELSARELIELMITRSSNPATDALLRVVGGPSAVNAWVRKAGIKDFRLDRDIATLVRDDGRYDPATYIDERDSATPMAMIELVGGIYQGRWLRPESREVLLGAMSRCVTGKHRIPALLPASAQVAHKTGTLNNTSSDVGLLTMPDGRTIAVAVYVTGQGSKPARDARIAAIAKAIHDGFSAPTDTQWANSSF
jgi:beta-lactamase class A